MRIVHQRCCALDVHKKSITACLLVWDGKQAVQERTKEFGTYKKELEQGFSKDHAPRRRSG
jgi:hypothetical protein